MDSNTLRNIHIRLTPEQVNDLLREKLQVERGERFRYARRIRRNRSTVTRLITGELRSRRLRKKLAQFIGVPEEMLPKKDGV